MVKAKGLKAYAVRLQSSIAYNCLICSFKTPSKTALKLHVKKTHGQIMSQQQQVGCSECGKCFETEREIDIHLNVAHSEKRRKVRIS